MGSGTINHCHTNPVARAYVEIYKQVRQLSGNELEHRYLDREQH